METTCVDGHSHLSVIGSYRPGPYPHKGKDVCVRDVCAIYDNNISPSLLMIIIKIIILYFIQIRHTDDFPPTGTLLVSISRRSVIVLPTSVLHGPGLGPRAGPARSPWAGPGRAGPE